MLCTQSAELQSPKTPKTCSESNLRFSQGKEIFQLISTQQSMLSVNEDKTEGRELLQSSDSLTHVYMCTLTRSHTFVFGCIINLGILGSFSGVSAETFKKLFFYDRLNSLQSVLYYCCLIVFLPLPHL